MTRPPFHHKTDIQRATLIAGILVVHEDKLLLVQENSTENYGKWNFPGGKANPGEHIMATARREFFEETGHTADITGLIGVIHMPNGLNGKGEGLLFAFLGTLTGGTLSFPKDEILDASWLSRGEIEHLGSPAFRAPFMYQFCLDAFNKTSIPVASLGLEINLTC